ncbi:MAG TPA: ribosome small subunit-dependent GTPase A [bacterium]|jgi:ribosome biogenesis GTPase|nr:ribosome small subunit-dependent GTPase A [bacterium]
MSMDLAGLGFDSHFAEQIKPQEKGLLVGRASFGSRGHYQVLLGGNKTVNAELKGVLRKGARGDQGDYPVVGDWLLLEPRDADRAIIVRALGRKNALIRREQARREAGRRASSLQILAANIDWGLITTSLNEEWNARRLERYIALVRESKARPAVLLTKADLAEDGGEEARLATRALSKDLPVLLLCAPDGRGLAELRALLGGHGTAVMIGSSGVGKSTLVNALLGDAVMATAEIREKDSHGRHTTAGRHLLPLPGGGCLIDSPGLRDLGLVEEDSAAASYDDIAELAARCRFSDCGHSNEPGCAVLLALKEGRLSEERWLSYEKLRDETAAAGAKIKGRPEKGRRA